MSLDRDLVEAALPAYEIGAELGRGAYGIVLAASHRSLGRPVAVKQLPRAFGADPAVRRRFLSEAKTLATMDHPHIVPIYDFVEHDGVCLLVMERLTGGTLWQQMREGPQSPQAACATVLAACAGLDYAHGRGVLHRDIKPDNLMFNGEGVLKITDFGIAKVVGSGPTFATKAGYTLGTPAYMAPEQAQGHELGPATDVYAIGTVLYELLSGGLPYPAPSDPLAALYQHVYEDPMPLADAAPELPTRITEVVDRAIARSLDERYGSAGELADDLTDAAERSWGLRWDAGVSGPAKIRQGSARPRSGEPAWATVPDQPAVPAPTASVPAAATPPAAVPAGTSPRGRRGRGLVIGLVALVAAAAVGGALLLGGGDDDDPTQTAASSTTTSTVPAGPPVAGFTIDVASGPVGQVINVTSTEPCPAPPDDVSGPTFVYVTIVDPRQVTADFNGDVYGQQFPVTDGSPWFAQIEVPGNTTVGETTIRSSCFGLEDGSDFEGSYYDYPVGVPFTVTP